MNRWLGPLAAFVWMMTSCTPPRAYGPVAVLPHSTPLDASFVLHAQADVTVHNAQQWQGRSLNDQPWLMVGTNGEGGAWFTYLRFPLHVLPTSSVVSAASLRLPRMTDIVLPEAAQSLPMHVWPLVQPWDEDKTTWLSQPHIEPNPANTVDLVAGAVEDEADLTIAVQQALQRGDAFLDVLLTPAVYDVDFRVRWPSRESFLPDTGETVDGFRRVDELPPMAWNVTQLPQVELRVLLEN